MKGNKGLTVLCLATKLALYLNVSITIEEKVEGQLHSLIWRLTVAVTFLSIRAWLF